jgi:inositol hexakisphosphate/diphosphoinositol-pentakisphosphate kinase
VFNEEEEEEEEEEIVEKHAREAKNDFLLSSSPNSYAEGKRVKRIQEPIVEEYDDWIIVNGTKINKPLVEKPVDGEDHNIYVYYPMRTGGGSKRLFRKVGDRASQFYKDENNIRRGGSYIYEEFLSTGGTDIKVYTCGPNYAHAEARKAPTLDGKVLRDENNKERRFPIVLNMFEKIIAKKVVLAFGMNICGFDILKSKNKSYVCDVNGFR